jgi:hypothetical protein
MPLPASYPVTSARSADMCASGGNGREVSGCPIRRIRSQLDEITARLFDFPAEDLITKGRVHRILTSRATALLAGQATPTRAA